MENKFKEKLYNFEGTPSLKVWDGIEKSLDKKKSSRKWIYAGLAVLVISISAFMGLSLSGIEKKVSITDNQKVQHQAVPESKTFINNDNPAISNSKQDVNVAKTSNNNTPLLKIISPQNPDVSKEITKTLRNDVLNDVIKQEQLKVKDSEINNKDLFPVLKIQIVSDMMPMYIDPMFRNLVITFPDPEIENNVRENIYQIKDFHFGFSAYINNTHILNQNSYNEFNGKNLATKYTYGNAQGFNSGYDFNSHLGIQTEFIFDVSKGQKFEDVYNGTQVSRDVSLKYDEVPVFIKYKMSSMSGWTKRPSVWNIIAGLEYGHLLSADENLMGTVTDITNKFNHNDLSWLAGVEYNLYFGKHWFFAVGGRCSYSLSDINAPAWKLQSGSGSTRNMILGGNFGFNYLY